MVNELEISGPSTAVTGTNMELELLKRARATIKGKVTRLGNWLNTIEDENDLRLEDVEIRLQLLTSHFQEYENVQNQIERLSNEFDENEAQRSRFEEQYFSIQPLLKGILNRLTTIATPPLVTQITSDDGTSLNPNSSVPSPHGMPQSGVANFLSDIKLPSISLPTFHGDPQHFLSFSELFHSLVDENPTLSKVARFYYLRASLKGPAAEVVNSLPSSASNYDLAWQILTERYQQKGLIIDRLNHELLSLPSVQTENAAALRKLLDGSTRIIRSLSAMDMIDPDRTSLIVTILTSKLDESTRKDYRLNLPSANFIPTYDHFYQYLDHRVQALESLNVKKRDQGNRNMVANSIVSQVPNNSQGNKKGSFPSSPVCILCKEFSHRIAQCPKYKPLDLNDKRKLVKDLNLCYNCLQERHAVAYCRSPFKCRFCSKKHHSSLHFCDPESDTSGPPVASLTTESTISLFNKNPQPVNGQILLSTASVFIQDSKGIKHPCKALLDSASEASFLSNRLATKLKLPRLHSNMTVLGIARTKNIATSRVFSVISSRHSNFSKQIEMFILPQITSRLPTAHINIDNWNLPPTLPLADDTFNVPSDIDLLIGAPLFYDLLHKGKLHSNKNRPSLLHTRLGWVVGGRVPNSGITHSVNAHLSLSENVERLWKLEESTPTSPLTEEELCCEQHFTNTHTRSPSGRYIVSLPYRQDPDTLGHSRSQARRRWLAVEARLSRNPELRDGYHKFMSDYLELGHMTRLGSESQFPEQIGHFYLAHHPVIKPESSSTKIRIVYDGSMTTTNGLSLNNILMVGPTIQEELFTILIRFRRHRFVFMADIKQMFRQVLITEKDRVRQLIFWRESPTHTLDIYQLNTVTYGTGPAPFLATRSLQQLAIDEKNNYPEASSVINDFYVDDFISGHDNLDRALIIQDEIISMLHSGGFLLTKWASNHPCLLENIPIENRESLTSLKLVPDEAVKALGLIWLPSKDSFKYIAPQNIDTKATTKRQVLSQLASLYDPLQLLGPVIVTAKIFMQGLWQENLLWDDKLPDDLTQQWETFSQSLAQLSDVSVPRLASSMEPSNQYQIHGFADASEKAYGCAIYLRTIDLNNKITVNLLCAKSRVAPLRQTSLPRLELSAALLLTRLMINVIAALKIPSIQSFCWSDSTVALSWIGAPSHLWKSFVANRVAEIQDFKTKWNHISSSDNPADIISRGCTVNKLKEFGLWWQGPQLLLDPTQPWQQPIVLPNDGNMPEKRKTKLVSTFVAQTVSDIFTRFSSLSLLIDVTAWCIRFAYNARNTTHPKIGSLSVSERNQAQLQLVRQAQRETFHYEISSITKNGYVSKKSRLIQLSPFLDDFGILRVGGRLKNTSLMWSKKHPAILEPNHPLTRLIIRQTHLLCLHGGAQLVLNLIQQNYWIINGRNAIRKFIHKCVPCFRARPRNTTPLMGQLPAIRITPARPFLNTGLDFAGPFMLRPPTRSNVKLKHYVAIFICTVTKCVHLELVSSLSTEHFLATLKRFTARRGLCRTISCDNATTFVGARNQLKEIYLFLRQNSESIYHTLAQTHIEWRFIPPLSPHFGGLWEAGVKSMKGHLRHVAGSALLTYEEFLTLLCTVEACLNSRPLTPLSADPADFTALTPGHFLIGAPLLAVPEIPHSERNFSRLNRWRRIQALTQHFWKRWSREYLTTLIPMSKWNKQAEPLAAGQMVIIKDDHLPPLQWKLGRISRTYPGKDNVIRVVSIKTSSGEITRNVHRVFPLPLESSPILENTPPGAPLSLHN